MDAYGEVVYADGGNAGQGGKVLISEAIIDELLDIRGGEWPQVVIERETSLLLDEDVNEDVIGCEGRGVDAFGESVYVRGWFCCCSDFGL